MIDKDFLSILACPACKSELTLDQNLISCKSCGRHYPIKDGIPVMLTDDASEPERNKEGGSF